MSYKIFTVFDIKAESYLIPFFQKTEGLARRAFADMVNSDDHPFSDHPEDYTLMKIGNFDSNNGDVAPQIVESLGNGLEYIILKEPKELLEEQQ